MAAGEDDEDKTEEPSQRKLDQAREKGDIIYTPEVGAALSLLATTAIVAFLSGPIVSQMAHGFIAFIASPDQFGADSGSLQRMAFAIVLKVMAILGFAALALALAGIASRYLQDRPTFTAQRMQPSIDKLDPIKGFGRVFGKAAVASFLKSLAKLGIVGAAMVYALWPHDNSLDNMPLMDPAAILPYVKERAVAMLIALTSAAAVLAAIDYVFTRQSYMKKQRMSHREIKEEHRQQEGDPMVKAKLRMIRHERSRKRMMANVPNASVIITNPTHYSIALKYDPLVSPAPICLAKGVDATALRIREVAGEHDIPIVENPPLARALFASAEIDEPIPREHYEAVAKVIGFVMRLAAKKRRRGAL